MASIYPNKKDGKIISFKFKTVVDREKNGKQISRCTTWKAEKSLSPSKLIRQAEKEAMIWEEKVRAEYDVRIVNNELKTMLDSVQKEYWTMVLLVVGNIPLMYMLNKDWFGTLVNTLPGKAVIALSGMVIVITAIFMLKFTKPIEYKR